MSNPTYDTNKYCCHDCYESHSSIGVCDFCTYYDFNGDEEGAYTEDGYCNLYKTESDPGDGCEDFVCFRVQPRVRD